MSAPGDEDMVEFTRLRELGSRSSLSLEETTELHDRLVLSDQAGSEEVPVVVKETAYVYYSRPTTPSQPDNKESETNKNPVGDGVNDGKDDIEGSSPNKTSVSKTKIAADADEQRKVTISDHQMDVQELGEVLDKPFYSLSGRYKPHAPGDEAFSPITLAMSFNADESEGFQARRPTITIRKLTAESIHSPVSMSDKEQTSVHHAKTEGGKLESDKDEAEKDQPDDKKASKPLSSATMQSVVSIMKHLSQVSQVKREPAKSMIFEDELEALRLSARAMMGLRRWKKRADVRLDMKGQQNYTIDTFAHNARHSEALHRNVDELATQLPLPVREMLYAEAFPILQDIVQAYERTLGQNNDLTEQAKSKITIMTTLMKNFDDL